MLISVKTSIHYTSNFSIVDDEQEYKTIFVCVWLWKIIAEDP